MSDTAISVRGLSKCYKLGAIGRHTLGDEIQYLWCKMRRRDPRQYMGTVGHTGRPQAISGASRRERGGLFWSLDDVSFDVRPGEVVGIIGRNGAGKSTLLKLLTRVTEPTSGEAFIDGRVGSLLEVGTGFHPDLTGRENVYMNGTILGMKKREIQSKFDQIVAFSELEQFLDTPVKRYSSGMYVRLAFAVAAHLQPDILLVDEVLAVGDAAFQRKCLGKMGEVSQEGRTILFVSHQMAAVQNLCGRVIWIDEGRLVLDDVPEKTIKAYCDTAVGPQGCEFARSSRPIPERAAVYLESARLEAIGGGGIKSVRMGEGFCVRMRFAARESIGTCAAIMNIMDATGTRLCSIRSEDAADARFGLVAGRWIDVVCRLPHPRFMPGRYALGIGIQRSGSRESLDFVPNALFIEVLASDVFGTGKIPRGAGAVYLESDWLFDSAKRPCSEAVE